MYLVYLVRDREDIEYSKMSVLRVSNVLPLITHGIALVLRIGLVSLLFALRLVVIIMFGGSFHFVKALLQAFESHSSSIVLDAKVFGDGWDVNLRVDIINTIHR